MIGRDFAYEQGIVTVDMNEQDRADAVADIDRAFSEFYRDNYPRFASMYDNRATVFGRVLSYADMTNSDNLFAC